LYGRPEAPTRYSYAAGTAQGGDAERKKVVKSMRFRASERSIFRRGRYLRQIPGAFHMIADSLRYRWARAYALLGRWSTAWVALCCSQQQLRELSARLESVREEERARLAYAIHDELGQTLTALKMDVVWLEKHLDAPEPILRERTRAICELIDTAIQSVRDIASELRPVVLDNFGLAAAIEWQLHEFQTRTGVACTYTSTIERTCLDSQSCTILYRIFQEILTNVSRHSGGTQLVVSLKEIDGTLILCARDNGRGITADELNSPRSFGLLAMRERARICLGAVQIDGASGGGTTVTVRVPLPGHSSAGGEASYSPDAQSD